MQVEAEVVDLGIQNFLSPSSLHSMVPFIPLALTSLALYDHHFPINALSSSRSQCKCVLLFERINIELSGLGQKRMNALEIAQRYQTRSV